MAVDDLETLKQLHDEIEENQNACAKQLELEIGKTIRREMGNS